MGRNRAYDEDSVLSEAMHAFRHRGYQAVSIRDLEDATGLKAGSIYNSFGDKAGLFDAAFAHYNRSVLAGRIDRHAPAEAGLDGLRVLFTSLLHEQDGEAFGCLITNTAVELGGAVPPHHCVEEGLGLLTRTFADRLDTAQRTGDLRAGVASRNAAVKLLALYQGLLVLIRAGHDKAPLERLIHDEFNELEAHHDA
jgi:TetR/AcrR family transcriptional regulator, transcriptional repressor for nem operon